MQNLHERVCLWNQKLLKILNKKEPPWSIRDSEVSLTSSYFVFDAFKLAMKMGRIYAVPGTGEIIVKLGLLRFGPLV